MTSYRAVDFYFYRSDFWNDTWDYPNQLSVPDLTPKFVNNPYLGFRWERAFDARSLLCFTRRIYWAAPCASLFYVIFVFWGPRLMQDRKPYNLLRLLQLWNLVLAILSAWGAIRVLPVILNVMWQTGFSQSLCIPPIWTFGHGSGGLWIVFFVYSKYLELIDTVFLVLRKRRVTFLHWFHHATVLLFSWDAFVAEQPAGVLFIAMNYTVHAVMYLYYYVASIMSKPPAWGMFVTILQIAQMFIGVAVTLIALRFSYIYPFLWYTTAETALKPFEIPGCFVDRRNLLGSMAIYSIYFYLFALFFWKRYVSMPSLKTKKIQ